MCYILPADFDGPFCLVNDSWATTHDGSNLYLLSDTAMANHKHLFWLWPQIFQGLDKVLCFYADGHRGKVSKRK